MLGQDKTQFGWYTETEKQGIIFHELSYKSSARCFSAADWEDGM